MVRFDAPRSASQSKAATNNQLSSGQPEPSNGGHFSHAANRWFPRLRERIKTTRVWHFPTPCLKPQAQAIHRPSTVTSGSTASKRNLHTNWKKTTNSPRNASIGVVRLVAASWCQANAVKAGKLAHWPPFRERATETTIGWDTRAKGRKVEKKTKKRKKAVLLEYPPLSSILRYYVKRNGLEPCPVPYPIQLQPMWTASSAAPFRAGGCDHRTRARCCP